ncbi:hypothetical protein CF319_g9553 [Tilletia indica]|nr:hypothetical protein CF319_g9553 [Tilletia indica]
MMNAHHKEALLWVTSRANDKGPPATMASITGIVHPKERMYKLAVMLREHMASLDPSSVVSKRIAELTELPVEDLAWGAALLLRTVSKTVLAQLPDDETTRVELDLREGATVHLHQRLRVYLQATLDKPKLMTLNYILPMARIPVPISRPTMSEPRPDAVMFIQERQLCLRAIEWRIGRFGIMCTCPAHKDRFKRACVDRCADGLGLPFTEADRQLLEEDIDTHWTAKEDKYLRLDAYLNHHKYKLFRKVAFHVDALIRKTSTVARVQPAARDISRSSKAKKTARGLRGLDEMDTSAEPDWVQPDDETEPLKIDWSKTTLEDLDGEFSESR